jgi:preprotein translocase subunit YajC
MENTKITLVSNNASEEVEASSPKDTFMSFIPLVLVFVVFYFLIIRPQSKKHKTKEDNIIVVEISKGTTVEALKSTIASIVRPTADAAATKK